MVDQRLGLIEALLLRPVGDSHGVAGQQRVSEGQAGVDRIPRWATVAPGKDKIVAQQQLAQVAEIQGRGLSLQARSTLRNGLRTLLKPRRR